MQQNSDYTLSIDWLNITMSPRNKYKLGTDGEPILSRKGKKMIADEFYDVDWIDKADAIINRICATLGLGAEVPARKNAQGDAVNPLSKLGYNVCKQYGDILIGYHNRYEYMGIIVQLSGDACRSYRRAFGDDCVAELFLISGLNTIADANDYMCAPTRVDIALDEYNGAWTVPQYVDAYYLQPQAQKRKAYIYTYRAYTEGKPSYGLANAKTSAIMSEGATLYVGSISSACRLRIYDKLAERTSADAPVVDDVDRWTRYELVVRKEYARAMGDALADIDVADSDGYLRYLASVLANKYVLCLDADGLRKHYIMQYLDGVADGTKTVLRSDDRRASTLVTSYGHIIGGSGLVGLAQKMVSIHDDKDAGKLVDALLLALKQEIMSAPMTDETARAIARADKSVDVLPADVVLAYDMLKTESAGD